MTKITYNTTLTVPMIEFVKECQEKVTDIGNIHEKENEHDE